ncbi:unnamed protein product, partial [Didymodactylos carnosus]
MAGVFRIPRGRCTVSKDNDALQLLNATYCFQNFTVIWLDSLFVENNDIHIKLKRIFNNLKPFNDIGPCIHYLFQNKTKINVLLIVSYLAAQEIIPVVHELPEIISIYIYCENKQQQEEWIVKQPFLKTGNNIFYDQNLFFKKLKDFASEQNNDENLPYNEALPTVGCFNQNEKNSSIRTLSKQTVEFIWFQLTIEILLRMPITDDSKASMINACRDYHKDNTTQKKHISEFEAACNKSTWTPAAAVTWYTSDTFCPRLTNKALGTQDPDYLFTFRFIITEIHKELDALHTMRIRSNTTLPTVIYRGKVLTMSQFQILNDNINKLVSMNGFLSASTDENVTDIYSDKDGTSDLIGYTRVLFKLLINDDIQRKPFASIKDISRMKDEKEILFSVGTIWQVKSITKDNKVWNVELELSNEDPSIEMINYLKKQLGEISTCLTLGNFLAELEEFEKANKYYQMLLKDLPEDHEDKPTILNNLACLECERGNHNDAAVYINQAIRYINEKTRNNSHNISEMASEVARCTEHVIAQHCNQTLYSATTATNSSAAPIEDTINLITKALTANHSSIGKIFNNQGLLYYSSNDYSNAMTYFKRALENFQEQEIKYPPDIAAAYNNIGVI